MSNPYDLAQESTTGAISPERSAFIMKVYGLLGASLLSCGIGAFTGGFVSTAMYVPLRFLGLLTLFAALFCRKMKGVNLALLFGFTFLNGMSAGTLLIPMMAHSAHFASLVGQSLAVTFGTFGALTAYVFWARTDFSYLKGFLFTALIGLILVSLISIFTGMSGIMYTAYLYVGLLVFIGFTLYDTSNLIHMYATDEYVAATLELFLDIVNLFWFILRIFASRDE